MSSRRPASVQIREIGPRDGFQYEPELISTADKIRLIELLVTAGYKRIEVASFVRPDVLPQLATARRCCAASEFPTTWSSWS